MSKPREFYLRYRMGELYCDDFEALNDGPTGFHVIEKSAYEEQKQLAQNMSQIALIHEAEKMALRERADELADVVEEAMNTDVGFEDWDAIREALKNYRGEK